MTAREQSAKVEAVLNEVLSEQEDWEEGDILVDWVVVCYLANPDKDLGGSYPMLFSNGEMPTYRIRGLLKTAMMQVALDDIIDDDEEDDD